MKLHLLCSSIVVLIIVITVVGNPLEANAQSQGGLKKYENQKYGISFIYPLQWNEPLDTTDACNDPTLIACSLTFMIFDKRPTINGTQSWWQSNKTTFDPSSDADKKILETPTEVQKTIYDIDISFIELDKPNINAEPCNCNTLKDFLAWDYIRTENNYRIFVNDNQTTMGKNYSAWQTEIKTTKGNTVLSVYSLNGNLGYKFSYVGPSESGFNKYLDGFRNMLDSVTLTAPMRDKKPSFLNSSNTPESMNIKSQDTSVKIMSSNDFIDSIGFMHVVGEIQNNTPSIIKFAKITGTFYDSSNKVVGTTFTYSNPSDISPGNKAPFELILTSAAIPVNEINNYRLTGSYN